MTRQALLAPFIASALFLGLSGTASAEDSPALTKCMNGANSDSSMVACQAQELKVQDARLNKAYQAVMNFEQGEKKQQLQDVQHLWIKYRDANCGFMDSASGGTIDRVNGAACRVDMTQTRAAELESLLPL
ncbi:lysozyme inhibitor LprI family protein [Pseudomonas sp. PWP3-1b2]|uniref:lysozyme inhibitor LprI family protein n=1 Tax=Pseudomonas sp. PWP3-1b2 TaxID=2804656 RepID=UPI003CE7294C